jgi:hypothetical protein
VVAESPTTAGTAPTAGTRKPRIPTTGASGNVAADPALRVVDSGTTTAAAPATEPTGSPQVLGNGVRPMSYPRPKTTAEKAFAPFVAGT